MKVFWLEKYTEEKSLPLYRCAEDQENILSIEINETEAFNNIFITNSGSSNLIFIINRISFMTDESNPIKCFMADNIKLPSKKKVTDLLYISFINSLLNETAITELFTISNSSSLLTDRYIILLPGGTIIIKTDKFISKAKLELKYAVEVL